MMSSQDTPGWKVTVLGRVASVDGGGIVVTTCQHQPELAEAPAAAVERLTIKCLQLQ